MILDNSKILKYLFEADTVETPDQEKVDAPKGFDEDPLGFIINKYDTLRSNLEELMGENFREYLTAIFIIADKPTTFKLILHNGQVFYMTYMGNQCYECNVAGKRHYLDNIGTKERAMLAIVRLLKYGNPLKTKGAEGTEQATREEESGEETAAATPAEETPPAEGGEELTESNVLSNLIESMIKEGDTSGSTNAEKVIEILFNIKYEVNSEKEMEALLKNKKDSRVKFILDYFNEFIKKGNPATIYYKACVDLPKSGKAQQLGAKSYGTTDTWKNFGGLKTVTSKTDVATEKLNFSVKNGSTKVRVLDASAPQVKALINYSVASIGYKPQIEKEITTSINKLQKIYTSSSTTLSRIYKGKKYGLGDLRKITDDELQKLIVEFDKNTKDLNNIVDSIFAKASTNPKFKEVFIEESLSGKTMFGTKSPGHADEILTFSSDFSIINSHKISKVTKEVASNYTVPKFGTKSSGSRIGKTVQQFYDPKKAINELFDKAEQLEKEKQQLLENRTLMEDSAFQKAFDYIRQKGVDVLNKIKQFVSNVLDKVKSFIDKLTELVKTSFTKALYVLGIDVEIEEIPSIDADIEYQNL